MDNQETEFYSEILTDILPWFKPPPLDYADNIHSNIDIVKNMKADIFIRAHIYFTLNSGFIVTINN